MLALNNITVQFGGLKAVNNLSIKVDENTISSIIGPNGAGKSTVFNTISRFYQPIHGNIQYFGKELLSYKPYQIIKLGIARSFQNVELFSKMTVLENLLIGLHPHLKKNFFSIALNLPSVLRSEKEANKKAYEVMEMLDLTDLANERVDNLPFGYQKMVDIARAIMPEPKMILLDEPVAGMNPVETERISELILKLKNQLGFTVLLIEHDMSLVMKISDYVTVMNFGKKIAEGSPNQVQNDPVVIEAYLGEVSENVKVN